jgi:hypothetical protein
MQGKHGAEHDADAQLYDHTHGLLAGDLQLRSVLAQPFHDCSTHFRRIVGQAIDDKQRQLRTRPLDQRGEALKK